MGTSDNFITAHVGDIEDFRIKGHTFKYLAGEDILSYVCPETFKTALGVLQIRQSDHPHHGVENPADQVAVSRLVITNRPWDLA